MSIANFISKQSAELHLDGTWISTNYKKELSEIDWKQATTQVSTLNTIAALTYHINYYLEGVNNVFSGGTLDIRDKYSFDLPPIESQQQWLDLQNKLYESAQQFANHIAAFSEAGLQEGFAGGKYGTNYRNITGVIEHGYYHLGQIVIIKKLLKEEIT